MTSLESALDILSGTFTGQLLQPTHADYEEARRIHNGLIDKRPVLIARCRGVADIVEALRVARDAGLEVSIRGGGHNVAGRAITDGGMVIDLTPMKGIHVNARARTVRAQGAVTWGELNRETQVHGLAVTGGIISSTGVAGLTLGGGMGWLQGKHGFAVDNLISVELVTADGRVLLVSEDEHEDLFWALRGGGGNFGVAASLEYRLHPVGPTVTGGIIAHPFPNARDVLRSYRDQCASLPDELTMFAGLIHAPDAPDVKLAGILACHCGSLEEGEAAMRPLKSFGTPAMDALGPLPYCQMNQLLDAGYPKGALNYWKSSFMSQLSDDAIDTMVDCYAKCPSPMTQIVLEHLHGAASRVGVSETAFPLREEGFNMLVLGQWMSPGDTERCTQWVRETFAALRPYTSASRYVNYMGDDEGSEQVRQAYGSNYVRLRLVKSEYDPDNFFHMNQNITPMS